MGAIDSPIPSTVKNIACAREQEEGHAMVTALHRCDAARHGLAAPLRAYFHNIHETDYY